MKSFFTSSVVLVALVFLSSCNTVKPAGSLGLALHGMARGQTRTTLRDYHDNRALPQNQTPMMWSAAF